MNDTDGLRLEAALQFGATCDAYTFTEAQLIAFAKCCERAGRGEAATFARNLGKRSSVEGASSLCELADALDRGNAATDAELAPILAAEEARFMTAQGYVRASDDQPGARWIKLEPIPVPAADYKCENCIGMIEHGCYCQAAGAVAPGGPLALESR